MPLLRSRMGARSAAVDLFEFISPSQRSIELFADQPDRFSIVPLAVRRKGIARSAVLHLDCARSAWSGSLSVRVGGSSCSVLIIAQGSPGERNSSKLLRDTRFDSFEFFLRHWSACPSLNEMIEQDLSPASFAPIS
jgi:hypothetical protein